MRRAPPRPTLFPYTTLFRSREIGEDGAFFMSEARDINAAGHVVGTGFGPLGPRAFLYRDGAMRLLDDVAPDTGWRFERSEEHTSELQSQSNLVCRLLLEKKK